MRGRTAKRADLWAGLFWVVFGGTIIAHSATMPIPRHLGATVLTGPGLVPGLLGGALVILGAVLAVRALRGTTILSDDEAGVDPADLSISRPAAALALMLIYAVALSLRQPFVPWTAGFVALFVTAFNWSGRSVGARAKLIAGALALGLATAFSVEFVFEDLFFVRLP